MRQLCKDDADTSRIKDKFEELAKKSQTFGEHLYQNTGVNAEGDGSGDYDTVPTSNPNRRKRHDPNNPGATREPGDVGIKGDVKMQQNYSTPDFEKGGTKTGTKSPCMQFWEMTSSHRLLL